MHPDAQRRRMESEERKRKTEERLRLQKLYGWWGIPGGPKNLVSVDNIAELKKVTKDNKLVCIKYFQPNCAACKTMYPKLMKIAE